MVSELEPRVLGAMTSTTISAIIHVHENLFVALLWIQAQKHAAIDQEFAADDDNTFKSLTTAENPSLAILGAVQALRVCRGSNFALWRATNAVSLDAGLAGSARKNVMKLTLCVLLVRREE